jgi:hypothetical protein
MTAPAGYSDASMGLDPNALKPRPLRPLQQPFMPGATPLGPLAPGSPQPGTVPAPLSTATAPAPSIGVQLGSPIPPLQTTSFGPGNNLVGAQINPTASPDTAAARTQLGSLFSDIGAQAPNRLAIAQNALKTFDEQQADQEKLGVQNIGREAAAAGRLGSGMVSTSLGDLQTQLNRAREQETRGLAGEVAGQTLNDRLAALSGTEGALGELSGLDTQAQTALRGERGYQATQDQQAIDNLVRQFGLEQGAQAQDFSQNFDTNAQLAALGFGGSSDATLGDVAGTYGTQGSDLLSGAGGILKNYFANKKPATAGAGSPYSFDPSGSDIYNTFGGG